MNKPAATNSIGEVIDGIELRIATPADDHSLAPLLVAELQRALDLGARGELPADPLDHARRVLGDPTRLVLLAGPPAWYDARLGETGRTPPIGFVHLALPHRAGVAPRRRAWHFWRRAPASPVPDPRTGRAFLHGIYVSLEWRRRGIAQRLVKAGEAQARAAGYPRMAAHVLSGNAASLALFHGNRWTTQALLLTREL